MQLGFGSVSTHWVGYSKASWTRRHDVPALASTFLVDFQSKGPLI